MPTFHVKNSILSYKVKIDYSHPQQLVTLGIHSFTSLDCTIFKLFHQSWRKQYYCTKFTVYERNAAALTPAGESTGSTI